MGETEESLDNMLRNCEDKSQNPQVNNINFVTVMSDPCGSNAVHLKQEECDVHVSDDTGENSVVNTAQSNPNMYSQTADKLFKCNICCKSFASKRYITSHLYKHTDEKAFKCDICNKSFFSEMHSCCTFTYSQQ